MPVTDYPCLTSRRTADGPHKYRYGRTYLHFPASDVSPLGRKRLYRYRRYDAAGEVVAAANCLIPATPAAVERTHRRFRVPVKTAGDLPRPAGSDAGAIGLEPLEVNACQNGNEWPDCDDDEGGDSASPEGPGGGGETETGSGDDPDPGIPCDTPDPVVNSTVVQAGFDRLWNGSNPDAPIAERRERGGWIVQRDGGFVLEPFPDAWTEGACAIDLPENTVPPAGTVAWVHTHPYTRGESLTICTPTRFELGGRTYLVYETYQNVPSGVDAQAAQQLNLPGYILDKDAITRFLPDLTTSRLDDFEITSQIARCGYGS